MAASPYRPSYVPEGYELRADVEGEAIAAFGEQPEQTTLVFTRGTDLSELTHPLMVSSTTGRTRPLIGTEGRVGQPVDLGRDDVAAVYHDGAWAPAPDGEGQDGLPRLEWDTQDVHAITVHWDGGACAVQGARSRGVTFEELVRVARSLPLVARGG